MFTLMCYVDLSNDVYHENSLAPKSGSSDNIKALQ